MTLQQDSSEAGAAGERQRVRAYLRETGLCDAISPRYHLERGNTGHAMCSSKVRLDKSTGLPPRYVGGGVSCMRPGCRQGWDRVDEVATFIGSTS